MVATSAAALAGFMAIPGAGEAIAAMLKATADGLGPIIKDKAPNLFGLGYIEEGEWATVTSMLSIGDDLIIQEVKANLDPPGEPPKLSKRWEMVVANMGQEEALYYEKTIAREKVTEKSGRVTEKETPQHRTRPLALSPKDVRLVHLKRVAAVYKSTGADKVAGLAKAKQYLLDNFLNDYSFTKRMLGWMTGLFNACKGIVSTGGRLASKADQATMGLIYRSIVGEAAFQAIVSAPEGDRTTLLEQALNEAIEDALAARRARSNSFVRALKSKWVWVSGTIFLLLLIVSLL